MGAPQDLLAHRPSRVAMPCQNNCQKHEGEKRPHVFGKCQVCVVCVREGVCVCEGGVVPLEACLWSGGWDVSL